MSRTRKGTSSQVAHPRESDLAPPDAPGATSTEGLAPRVSRFLPETGHSFIRAAVSPAEDSTLRGCPCCLPWAWGLPAAGTQVASSPHAWPGELGPDTSQLQTSPSASRLHPGASDAPNSARATLSTGPSPPGRPTWAGAGLAAPGPKSLSSPPLCHAQLSLDTDTCPKGDPALSPPTPPPHAHPRL